MLYEYGLELLAKCKTEEGWKYIIKAASLNHYAAKKKWETYQGNLLKDISQKKPNTPPSKVPWVILLLILLMIAIGFILFLLFSHFFKDFYKSSTEYSTTYERYYQETSKDIIEKPSVFLKTKGETLPVLVVQNAVERYKEYFGSFPESSSSLTNPNPDNFLSFIPKDVVYTKRNTGYYLHSKIDGEDLYVNKLLSLHLYPDTNQLALQRDDEILALFSVATGRNKLPPTTSSVTERVVEPQGRNGAFGSKGLALTDNFAIHGTNDETSIGKKLSEGCVRMRNEDIDLLFPYISLGTPFIVEHGAPGEPTFATLPPLSEDIPSLKESSSTLYNWKD
ncbi:L,D-transpeptidase [Bacillus sp. V5-8f]|uniref:L,D-transpeptidase n=1 Tax=Bacillus sp. V5-8f TaxID=2053044 RepID=UPI000C76F69A|nr:L,D-transpeptidase [Bacillus sp. V5-8f]PLT32024.1 hypothetical protein CUU64_20830 [Bacillus sp. V5-8f]